MGKVYIISQANAYCWSARLKINHATLDKNKAKKILRKIILDAKKEAKANGEKIDKRITKKDIDDYIDRLTDENRPEYSVCSDYCNWVNVWCDIIDVE